MDGHIVTHTHTHTHRDRQAGRQSYTQIHRDSVVWTVDYLTAITFMCYWHGHWQLLPASASWPRVQVHRLTTQNILHTLANYCEVPSYRQHRCLTLRLKCKRIIISPSHGWKKACFMLLYRMSTLSPRTDVKRKPDTRKMHTHSLAAAVNAVRCCIVFRPFYTVRWHEN